MEFYQNASNNTNTLEAAYHSEGRVVANGNKWEYNLKDHLGNVRLVFTESNGLASIVQENHYYPFGMQQNGNWAKTQTVKNDYLYNGKEMNTEIGLNWSDYGNRFYIPSIGRFASMDKLASHPNQVDKSPYAYGWNNPIKYDDPDGNCPNCVTAGVGAGVGALVGGASNAIGSWWRGEKVSLKEVGKAALAGAVAGAVIGSGAGLVAAAGGIATGAGTAVTAGVGVASGVVGETVSQGLDMADGTRAAGDFDVAAIVNNIAIAGPLNVVSAGAANALKGPITKAAKNLVGKSNKAVKTAQNQAGDKVKAAGGTNAQFDTARKIAKQEATATSQKNVAITVQSATQAVSGTINGSTRSAANSQMDKEKK